MKAPDRTKQDLGDFVRARRERISPESAGLPGGGRRRTPGLRREEAAQLSGLSVTWYTWLEQGRDVSVSPQALARLAAAFRLAPAERAYLFELAGRRDPSPPGPERESLPAPILASVRAVAAPAYILDRVWTVRAWNAAAGALFAGWLDEGGAGTDRNLLRFIFLHPAAPVLIADWSARAGRSVAEFRASLGAHLEDAPVRALVEDLQARSADFADLWRAQAVLGREGGERAFNHPEDGPLAFDQVTLAFAGRPDLKLVMLLPRAPV